MKTASGQTCSAARRTEHLAEPENSGSATGPVAKETPLAGPRERSPGRSLPFTCSRCGGQWGFLQSHDAEQCLTQRLRHAEAEVRHLQADVASWKDAWYDQRRATGTAAFSLYRLRRLPRLALRLADTAVAVADQVRCMRDADKVRSLGMLIHDAMVIALGVES